MLGCEGRNTLVLELLLGHTQGISNGENTGVEHTNNISGISLI